MDEIDLNQIFNLYPTCINNGARLRATLNDLYPGCSKAVVNILVSMADCGICEELCSTNRVTALDKSRWKRRLEDDYGFSESIICSCFDLFGQYDTYSTNIVGVTYDGRQRLIHNLVCANRLKQGTRLLLELDAQNQYNMFAVKVMTRNRDNLGYIPKELSKDICLNIKRGKTYSVIVTSIVGGGNNYNYGVKIDIAMNGSPKRRDFRSTEIDNIRIGMTLWHNFYGIGNVINVKKETNETYVTLLFGDVEKTFASSLSLGKYLFTFDCIPPVEYMPEEYKLPETYQPREMQKQQRDIDNDDKYIERFNSMFDYDGDVYDAGRVVHFDELEDFEDYDGLIDSGDTSMDYDDYD